MACISTKRGLESISSPGGIPQGGSEARMQICPHCGGKLRLECYESCLPGQAPVRKCVAVCLGRGTQTDARGSLRWRPRGGCGRVLMDEFSPP